MTQVQRFLVKLKPGASHATTSLALDSGKIRFTATRLFQSIPSSRVATVGLAAAESITPGSVGDWHVLEASSPVDAPSPWDVCHALVAQGLGVDGAGMVTFAEPDLPQRWYTNAPTEGQTLAAAKSCAVEPQSDKFPRGATDDWYRDGDHTGLASTTQSATGAGVRIAHLDTGYDPDHLSRPANLEKVLERNFVDEDRPNDATDRASGIVNNHGHGTGTLSILAGQPIGVNGIPGVAPNASIVPIRVADSVVLFYNSAIAKALDYVHSLCKAEETFVHVVSMSMGGLASRAWADAVNALYESGVVVVTAAGNNYDNLPTRQIVFPARFQRVIAACGVMEDHTPYADLGFGRMAGNYGPQSKMRTAMSAYTPNIPWAEFGCPQIVSFNGAGTSSATPQVAATAALYIQQNKVKLETLAEPWMRAQAVRQALLKSNPTQEQGSEKLGNSVLKAQEVFDIAVPNAASLKMEPPDKASFAFLRVLTGLGVQQDSERQEMLELEALQLSQTAQIEQLLPDPNELDALTDVQKAKIAHALFSHPQASRALRSVLRPMIAGGATTDASSPSSPSSASNAPKAVSSGTARSQHAAKDQAFGRDYPTPAGRRLRVYAYDPSLGESLQTFTMNESVLMIYWESDLKPGPIGEYLEVIDVDPATGVCYPPVDLNDPRLLAVDGIRPSEANPRFHQQMVYAVAMKTIEFFERGLGRRALWAPRIVAVKGSDERENVHSEYVQRLRIYPHALRTQNAYYSPEKKALLLGYFSGSNDDEGGGADRQLVFTALSSDIIAHETTHSLLDGLHRRFREPTNPDVLAFHEAFADIVALFQHFAVGGSLRNEIARTRGNLDHESILSQLAVQFGKATERHGALRDAIAIVTNDDKGNPVWQRRVPTKTDYQAAREDGEPHQLGAVLVAAVFDAFLQIYSRKAIGPIRLATGGSEVLAPGALPGDLADALADVAATVAGQVLLMCIRALDYCPPVDITFGDFLRAVITADKDLIPDDPHGYRIAFAYAFRARGIYPESVLTISADTLGWESIPVPLSTLDEVLSKLNLRWDLQTARRTAWETSRENARLVHQWLTDPSKVSVAELAMLGLERAPDSNYQMALSDGTTMTMALHGIEVHSVRPLRRVGPDGQLLSQLVVELTQSVYAKDGTGLKFRGGCTLIIDMNARAVSYLVRKRMNQPARVARQYAFWSAQDSGKVEFMDNYRIRQQSAEPFALLHGAV